MGQLFEVNRGGWGLVGGQHPKVEDSKKLIPSMKVTFFEHQRLEDGNFNLGPVLLMLQEGGLFHRFERWFFSIFCSGRERAVSCDKMGPYQLYT